MDKNIFFRKQGFTLIEVLVVVAIISILSAVLYMNFGEARTEARNKNIRNELKSAQLAIENYRAQNNQYPTTTSSGFQQSFNFGVLVPDFLPSALGPQKSANTACRYDYYGDVSGTFYKLVARNCLVGSVSDDDPLSSCPSICGTTCSTDIETNKEQSLAVYSAGGQCE